MISERPDSEESAPEEPVRQEVTAPAPRKERFGVFKKLRRVAALSAALALGPDMVAQQELKTQETASILEMVGSEQECLGLAARNPRFVLEHFDKIERTSYGDKALYYIMATNPLIALKHFQAYEHLPDKAKLIKTAIEQEAARGQKRVAKEGVTEDRAEDVAVLFKSVGRLTYDEGAYRLLKNLTGIWREGAIANYPSYRNVEGADSFLERAVNDSLHNEDSPDAIALLKYYKHYAHLPEAEHVLRLATDRFMGYGTYGLERLFEFAKDYKHIPWMREELEAHARTYPWVVMRYASVFVDDSWGKALLLKSISAAPKYSLQEAERYANLPGMKVPFEQAVKIAITQNPGAILVNAYKLRPLISNWSDTLRGAVDHLMSSGDYKIILENLWRTEYKDEPWCTKVLLTAIEKDPVHALRCFDTYHSALPDADSLFDSTLKKAGKIDPSTPFDSLDVISIAYHPSFSAVLEQYAADGHLSALDKFEKYRSLPNAMKILRIAAQQALIEHPAHLAFRADQFPEDPQIDTILVQAASAAPLAILSHEAKPTRLARLLKRYNPALFNAVRALDEHPQREKINVPVQLLAGEIAEGRLSVEEAIEIGRDQKSFLRKILAIYISSEYSGTTQIEERLKSETLMAVQQINYLHDRPDAVRFKAIEGLSSQELYMTMVYGEEELFTSSFNGVFNRFLDHLKKDGTSGSSLLEQIHFKHFRTLIKLAASFNRLNEFLNTMSEESRSELMARFVTEIEHEPQPLAEAVTVADTFGMIDDPKTLGVLQATVQKEFERVSKAGDRKGIALYGLLAGMFAEKAVVDEAWFKAIEERYHLPHITELSSQELRNPDGTNVQEYFFYNDEDGINSFESFLIQYQNDLNWRLEDKGTYIRIVSTEGKVLVEIYANKPTDESGYEDIQEELKERNLQNIVVVHRGHSYHAGDTIQHIPSAARIVSMGSCGGYRNLEAIISKAPKAHLISTKGTGTMKVNDPMLKALNEKIRNGEDINWPTFWREMEAKLGKNPDFGSYVPPHRNLGMLYLRAYRQELSGQDGQKGS